MLDLRLYMLQRASALLMAPMVLVHLFVIIYAIRGGVSAEEILGRTRGSVIWALFYGSFVVAIAIHGAIGLRVIVAETLKLRGAGLSALTWAVFAGLLVLGMRAVYAVTVTP